MNRQERLWRLDQAKEFLGVTHAVRDGQALDAADSLGGGGGVPDLPYFAGLKIEEAADILGISEATAKRWWSYARAWLFHDITTPNNPISTDTLAAGSIQTTPETR